LWILRVRKSVINVYKIEGLCFASVPRRDCRLSSLCVEVHRQWAMSRSSRDKWLRAMHSLWVRSI
jgi:hypothetical protein